MKADLAILECRKDSLSVDWYNSCKKLRDYTYTLRSEYVRKRSLLERIFGAEDSSDSALFTKLCSQSDSLLGLEWGYVGTDANIYIEFVDVDTNNIEVILQPLVLVNDSFMPSNEFKLELSSNDKFTLTCRDTNVFFESTFSEE